MTTLIFENPNDAKDFADLKTFSITNIEAPTVQTIYEKGMEIKDDELRSLYYMLYLTGSRISEVLQIQKDDITEKHFKGHAAKEIKIVNLKNRKTHLKIIIIPIDFEYEGKMWDDIQKIIDNRFIGQKIFLKYQNRNYVWNLLSKIKFEHLRVLNVITKKYYYAIVKLHPHLLRHFRLTHLVVNYGFSIQTLKEVAGWSSSDMANYYIALSSNNIISEFYKA